MPDKIRTTATDKSRQQHVQTVRLQGLEDGDGLADLPKKRITGSFELKNNPSVVTVSGLSLRTSSFQENNTSRRNSKVWPDDKKAEAPDNPEKPQNRRKSSLINNLNQVEPPRCPGLFKIMKFLWELLDNRFFRQMVARSFYIAYFVFLNLTVVQIGQNSLYYWLYLSGFTVFIAEFIIFSVIYPMKDLKDPKFWTPSVASFILVCLPMLNLLVYLRYIHGVTGLCSDSGWEQIIRNKIFDVEIDATSLYNQLMIIILVLARWIYRPASTTSEAISQLLIATIGAGADIVELLDVFETEKLCDLKPVTLFWMVIPLYNLSLLQFIVVLTAKKKRRLDKDTKEDLVNWFWYTEAWGLMFTSVMQDGPFFLLRCALMFMGDVTQTRIFFAIKNFLMVALIVNRVLVIRKDKDSLNGGTTLVWK